ncbi:MAG TPA: hypothetical protein DCL35_03445 [Candidatus Omnitrophica bacterium]|nr:hypothetical protein [Candidatus Omnitrophota bacterium]
MRKGLMLILTLLILSIFFAHAQAACFCKSNIQLPPISELERSDAVFVGEVVNIGSSTLKKLENHILSNVVFKVSVVYKGDIGEVATVFSPKEKDPCSYDFKKGEKYLVYAHLRDGVLYTDYCTRTKLYSRATNEGDINQFNLLGFGVRTDIAVADSLSEDDHLLKTFPILTDVMKSDVIFSGKALSIADDPNNPGLINIEFFVDRIAKGWPNRRTVACAPKMTEKNAIKFAVGDEYLIFAKRINGCLYTDNTTKTQFYSQALRKGLAQSYGSATSDPDFAKPEESLNSLADRAEWLGAGFEEFSPVNRSYRDGQWIRSGKRLVFETIDFSRLFEAVKQLVLSYYPDARIEISNNGYFDDALRFSYSTKIYGITGPAFQVVNNGVIPKPSYIAEGPKSDGILGTVYVFAGNNIDTTPESRYLDSTTAFDTYGQYFQSKIISNCYLHLHVLYPIKSSDSPSKGEGFKNALIGIAKKFDDLIDMKDAEIKIKATDDQKPKVF